MNFTRNKVDFHQVSPEQESSASKEGLIKDIPLQTSNNEDINGMLVQYRVQHSPRVNGLGIFAMEDIKEGTMTWKATLGANVAAYTHEGVLKFLETHPEVLCRRFLQCCYYDYAISKDGVIIAWDGKYGRWSL